MNERIMRSFIGRCVVVPAVQEQAVLNELDARYFFGGIGGGV